MMQPTGTSLIRKGSADEIVAKRDRALDLYVRALGLLADASRLHKEVAGTSHTDLRAILDRHIYSIERGECTGATEAVRQDLDSGVWQHIMGALGLMNLMDAQAVAEFRDQNAKAAPEVTRDNLVATFARLTAESESIFRRGVINLFTSLDRSFASNPAYRLGEKLIFTGAISEHGGWTYWGKRQEQMRDLDRIFHIVDEEPPKDHCGDAAAMVAQATRRGPGATVETDYFQVRTFKNGNIHVRFRRAELVAKVNRIIADHFGDVLAHERRRPTTSHRKAA